MVNFITYLLKNRIDVIIYFKVFTEDTKKTIINKFYKYQDQIDFVKHHPLKEDYYKDFSKYDLYLDSFPYNSQTTILEALYNNCPVISLSGEKEFSRIGKSILTNIKHEGINCK